MSVQSQQPLAPRVADEAEVRALYRRLMAGWNEGSGEAFAAPFAEDADLVGFDGTHLGGRHEIAWFHQQLFDTWVRGSRLVGTVRSVRFLPPTVALMHAVGGTVMTEQADLEPERSSVQTLVAVRAGDEWRLAALQNTRATFVGRPEEARALTEELRRLL